MSNQQLQKGLANEHYVKKLASSIPGVEARLASPEENYGRKKADIFIVYEGEIFPIQVSEQPKSRKEKENLKRRGTHPISVSRFSDKSLTEQELLKKIYQIIGLRELFESYA